MKKNIFIPILLVIMVNITSSLRADIAIGAQVFIEPGQTDQEVESWFRIMNESGMTVCRIRMFEEYMKQPDGSWNFSLFDRAFDYAEKYNIRVFATLFPALSDGNNTIGGFKFPESDKHLQQVADYVEQTVTHFKNHKGLHGWVLMNEPGVGGVLPDEPYTHEQFLLWKKKHPTVKYNNEGYPLLISFDKEKFLLDYTTQYLGWIASQIKKHDPHRHLHVNNHQIFENVAEYDFPAWRTFLSSFGASAHPSWHFGLFERSKYTLALSANCEIVRSGAGKLPFWITELQAGNNIYSGSTPFCPTKEEITQWLWTGVGTGVDGIIFWSLNPRSIGEEAGEWALLNFQNKHSDRSIAVKEVTRCLSLHKNYFANSTPLESPINILYTRESLWMEKKVQYGSRSDMNYEGRLPGSGMKSALAFYEILSESGVKSNLKEISEYEWDRLDYSGECIIIAHQISIHSKYWEYLDNFVSRGGKLIVEGLTAFYDENMFIQHNRESPIQQLFGGALSEVKTNPGDHQITINETIYPVHLSIGYIINQNGKVLSKGENPTAIRNKYGKGEVLWIPSQIGLGAIRTDDKEALHQLLIRELKIQLYQLPLTFSGLHKGVHMETLNTPNGYLTFIVNKSKERKKIILNGLSKYPELLFRNFEGTVLENTVEIFPEETMVVHWKKQ